MQLCKARYYLMVCFSLYSVIQQVCCTRNTATLFNVFGVNHLLSSILQLVRTRKTAFEAVNSPFSFVKFWVDTIQLCIFWILSIHFYVFFRNTISKTVWAPIATGMLYLFEKGYPILPSVYAITLVYFVFVYLICKQYPSIALYLYTTYTHAFVSVAIGNNPAKEVLELVPKFLVFSVISAGSALAFYAGYTVFDHELSKKSVQDAIDESLKPNRPTAEKIISMQIKVRESFHLSNILRPYVEALSKSSSVSIAELEAEIKKLEFENEKLIERVQNSKAKDPHVKAIDFKDSPPVFPFEKKDFNPVVWEILKRVHGEDFFEKLKDRPASQENQDALRPFQDKDTHAK